MTGITKREKRERAKAAKNAQAMLKRIAALNAANLKRKLASAQKISSAKAPPPLAPPTKAKYNAAGRRVNGIWCASDAEATRLEQLLIMQANGTIENLRCQVRFPLVINNIKVGTYVADFTYILNDPDTRLYREVVEEVKGMETPEWKLKARVFEAIYYPQKVSLIKRAPSLTWLKENDPEMAEKMAGHMASFSYWITQRWSGKVPD